MSRDRFAPASGLLVDFQLDLTPAFYSKELLGGKAHPFGHLADCVSWRDKNPSVGSAGRNNLAELILDFG